MSLIRSWVCRTVPAIVLVGSVVTLAPVGDSSGFQSYTVKEAQITYALSGMRNGTRSLAFTDYGSRTIDYPSGDWVTGDRYEDIPIERRIWAPHRYE